jgi:hypothetical protein
VFNLEEKGKDASYTEKIRKRREKWDKLSFDTQTIRAGEDPYPETSHSIRTPIFAAKSYTYDSMDELLKGHSIVANKLYQLLRVWLLFILLVQVCFNREWKELDLRK